MVSKLTLVAAPPRTRRVSVPSAGNYCLRLPGADMRASDNWLMLILLHDEGTCGLAAHGASKHPPAGVVAGLRAARRPRSCCCCRRSPGPRCLVLAKTGTFNVGSICCASFSAAACCVLISLLMVTCDMQMSGPAALLMEGGQ